MKKILAIVVLLVMASGCAFICAHKDIITTGLNVVILTAQELEQMGVPVPVVVLLEDAISLAKAGLAARCPDVVALVAAQDKLQQAVNAAQALGYKVKK